MIGISNAMSHDELSKGPFCPCWKNHGQDCDLLVPQSVIWVSVFKATSRKMFVQRIQQFDGFKCLVRTPLDTVKVKGKKEEGDFFSLRCHCCLKWLVVHIFEAFVVEISLWQNEADYPWGKHGQTHQLGTNSSWIEVLPRGNRDQIAFGRDSLSMVHLPRWSQIRDCWWRV